MTAAVTASILPALKKSKPIPVGLKLYSMRDQLKADLPNTLRVDSKMGYEGVDFYASYPGWTRDYANDVCKQLHDLRPADSHRRAKWPLLGAVKSLPS